MTPAERAERLRALHHGREALVLPNAWDVASALRFEALGFPAIATTSAGVAESLGYSDGDVMPAAEMLAAVARIARAVSVPVTADLEAGYGEEPALLVEALLEAGAVGLNYEDSDHHGPGQLVDTEVQAERLAALKTAGRERGVDIVLNARVDVHLRAAGYPDQRLDEALRRAVRYCQAGADCVYPIGIVDEQTVGAFVAGVPGPVNMLAFRAGPSVARLKKLGVRRVSFGSLLMRAALKAAEKKVADFVPQTEA